MKIIQASFVIEPADGIAMLKKIEAAGRTCYKSEGKIADNSYIGLIQKLIKSGHESVLEHEKVTIRLICDRGVTHEIVRHRIASYSQESTRFCNYAGDSFGREIALVPMMDNLTEAQTARRMELWRHIEQVYMAEIGEGIAPQQARDNLPTCLKTEIVITYNLREWRYFFRLRTGKKAHPQMRKITIPLLAEFKKFIPIVFDDINPEE